MSLFNKHQSCRGLTLFRFGRWNVELWFCPAGYTVEQHSHPEEHIELMFLYGQATFYRISNGKEESFTPTLKDTFRTFSITEGTVHWFSVSKKLLVFINIARFKNGIKPKSAAVDFKPV